MYVQKTDVGTAYDVLVNIDIIDKQASIILKKTKFLWSLFAMFSC